MLTFILNLIGIVNTTSADDLGLEASVSGMNTDCRTPNLDKLASRSVNFRQARTTVSSCSPSRAALLSGLPSHQNGMYGLHHDIHHYNSFDDVQSISNVLKHTIPTLNSGLIGKKHVGPPEVFKFDFEVTEDHHSILQIGRNITLIAQLVQEFLAESTKVSPSTNATEPFFLYVGLHDAHRCGHSHSEYGPFCETFGINGTIPDWTPTMYDSQNLTVPEWMPDTAATRGDLAAQYQTISRLDQGVGLILNILESFGVLNETLVIFSSDNGSPFPNGRTNVYEPGLRVPLLLSNPNEQMRWGSMDDTNRVTLLDIFPTLMDWFQIKPFSYKINNKMTKFTGSSLMPLIRNFNTLKEQSTNVQRYTYASHVTHEATMNYPMRSVTDHFFNLKLIQNLNFWAPFPIDQDFYLSPTFQNLLFRTRDGVRLNWLKSLKGYYYRPEFECFDLNNDTNEIYNTFSVQTIECEILIGILFDWQLLTNDPWLCAPHGVLQNTGIYTHNPVCMTLGHQWI